MSLIVEDGSGMADAESYTSVTEAGIYHANFGNTAWAALTVAQQEAALRNATQYMLATYRTRWLGLRASIVQALDWPRIGVILQDTASYFVDLRLSYTVQANIVHPLVVNACAVMALKAATQGDLMPDLDQRTTMEKVGPMQINYDRFSPQARRFRSVDMLLNPLLDGSGGMNVRINRG